MAYSGVETLVFPDSTYLREGLYVEPWLRFFINALNGCRDGREKEPFWLKPLPLKQMYAFSRKNKVFLKKPLMCPDSMCLGEGLYVELFLIGPPSFL